MTLACLGLWRSFAAVGSRRTVWIGLAYAAMALAVMSKGLLGLVLPLLGGVLYLGVTGPLRAIPRRLGLGVGLPVFLAIVLAWYGPAVARYGTGYLRETIVHQQVERYARTWVHREPWYQYFADFTTGFLPWSLFVPGAIALAWQARRDVRGGLTRAEPSSVADSRTPPPFLFPLCWFVAGFVFFSLSPASERRTSSRSSPPLRSSSAGRGLGGSRRAGARAGSGYRSPCSQVSPPSWRSASCSCLGA